MKTFALAAAAAAFALTSGVAFAENPNLGIPAELQSNQPVGSQTGASHHSYGAPSVSIQRLQGSNEQGYVNPAANRFGDAQPRD